LNVGYRAVRTKLNSKLKPNQNNQTDGPFVLWTRNP